MDTVSSSAKRPRTDAHPVQDNRVSLESDAWFEDTRNRLNEFQTQRELRTVAMLMRDDEEPSDGKSFVGANIKRTHDCRQVAATGRCLTERKCDISCLTFPGMLAAFIELVSGLLPRSQYSRMEIGFVHPRHGARMYTDSHRLGSDDDETPEVFTYGFQFTRPCGTYIGRRRDDPELHATIEPDPDKHQMGAPGRGYRLNWTETAKQFVRPTRIGTNAPATRAIAAACFGHTHARVTVRVAGIAQSYMIMGLIPALFDWFRSVAQVTQRTTFTVYGASRARRPDKYSTLFRANGGGSECAERVVLHVQSQRLRVATNEQILGPMWSDTEFVVPLNIDSEMKAEFNREYYTPPQKGTLYRLAPGMTGAHVVIRWDGIEKMSLVEWLGLQGRWFED
jgi:hypothetical protein